ncbi:MAG: DUF58 domain-containing protein [Chloroflexota bacterium]
MNGRAWPWSGRASAAVPSADAAGEIVFDEAFLARLRRLTVLPGQVRAEGIAGEHRSRRRGVSPEFADFKPYSPGDDFRRIDWNTYARLDGLFVRLSEVTSELEIHVLVDASQSMQWRAGPERPAKFTQARRLAGALGYVALWHFDRLTVTPYAEGLGRSFGPAQGRAQALPMLKSLEAMTPLGGAALPETIGRYVHARRRPGVLAVISDLLSGEPEDLRPHLRDARARGWEVTLAQVLDEAELFPDAAAAFLTGDEPGAEALIELVDSESGGTVQLARDEGLLREYGERIAAWQEELTGVCAEEGATHLRVLCGLDLEEAVYAVLRERGVVA